MADTGNIFDNSAIVTPGLAGQGEPVPAGNAPIIEPPAATPEGQVVQEPTNNTPVPATPPQPEQQPADWASEFATPEEMYAELQRTKQSYMNIRPQYTKVTQELSALRKGQAVDKQPQVAPQQQPATVENVILSKVADIVRPVKEQNEELMMQNEVARIASANPDFIQLASEVSKMLKENPQYWGINNPIETVYKIVKAEKANEAIAAATTNARNQAYADKELKVLNPTGANPQVNVQSATKTPEQVIKEGIMSAVKHNGSIF